MSIDSLQISIYLLNKLVVFFPEKVNKFVQLFNENLCYYFY